MRRLRAGSSEQVIWRARLVLGCLALIALCFQQAPGHIVGDRKLELTAGPGSLLTRALHLWDPHAAFGQLQSDAYGYLLPMGPFHWLLDMLSVSDWVAQRMWWSLTLCVAFLGVWKLCNVLEYGVPWTRFASALLYALLPHAAGALPIEAWPLAMAPWVLLPLVSPQRCSGWWRAGRSAVAFALIGGADPVGSIAILGFAMVWLLRHGRAKLLLAWSAFVGAVSIWWLVPLLMGAAPEGPRWPAVAGAVVGLPLALVVAHHLRRLTNLSVSRGLHRRVVPAVITSLAVAAALPVVLTPPASVAAHWEQAAKWLDSQSAQGTVLVLSDSTEPLAALIKRPMAALTEDLWSRVDSGVGDQTLRQELARDGVRYVVVRNDQQDPPAAAIHESLADAGIGRVASFGSAASTQPPYPSVEIFEVGTTTAGRLIPRSRLVAVDGSADDVPTVVAALGGQGAAVLRADANGTLDQLPLIETDGRSGRQPSAVVLRNRQIGRSACLHIGARAVCSRDQAKASALPNGLSRMVQLPQAASFQVHGIALPKDGGALEQLLAVPGAVTAAASSRAVTAPEGRPGAAVDRDPGTSWQAAADDAAPTLTLTLPAARDLQGLRFQTDADLNVARPAELLLRFDGSAPMKAVVDPAGYVPFPARQVRTVAIAFTATRPLQDTRTTPVGVGEIELLGADDLRKSLDPARRLPAYCGNGPNVRVDGVLLRTQVSATVRDLLRRRPVAFGVCGDLSTLPLQSGRHEVEAQANGGLVPVETTFVKAGFGNVSVTPVRAVNVWHPSPTELAFEVPDAGEESVLAVAQTYNQGWEAYDGSGRKLTPIRVGGRQQGWILPAGPEQVVTARFMPDRTYRAGLLLGLVALLSVFAVAVFAPKRSTGRSRRR